MSQREITDELVLAIYSWFQSAMGSVGRVTHPPQCRDITKTYTFRAVKMFTERCYNQWGLDDRTTRALVYDVVRYAQEHGILSKGTQVLIMGTVLEICRKGLQESIEAEANLRVELRRCQNLMETLSKDTRVSTLREPVTFGGYSRLVYWHNLGQLTTTYVALSLTCLRALHSLPASDRSQLPPDSELLRICTHTISDENFRELKTLLGDDLRVPPTVRVR